MTFEDKLNDAVLKYQEILNRCTQGTVEDNKANIEALLKDILKAKNINFSGEGSSPLDSILIKDLSLPFPNGFKLFYKVKDEEIPEGTRYDYINLRFAYDEGMITTVKLEFNPGLCPRVMEPKEGEKLYGKFWIEIPKTYNYVLWLKNKTKYGTIYFEFGEGECLFHQKRQKR